MMTINLSKLPRVMVNMEAYIFVEKLYHNSDCVEERHRHRYEVNPSLTHLFEEKGFNFCAQDVEGVRMEAIELEGLLQHCMLSVDKFNQALLHPFRSSLFCWSSISSRVHLKASGAFPSIPWLYSGRFWKT